jgi:hypothetical protein
MQIFQQCHIATKEGGTSNNPYLGMQNFIVNAVAIWVAINPPNQRGFDWLRTILIHSLHKKMLDPNSANPEAEPLAHGCVFPRTSW